MIKQKMVVGELLNELYKQWEKSEGIVRIEFDALCGEWTVGNTNTKGDFFYYEGGVALDDALKEFNDHFKKETKND